MSHLTTLPTLVFLFVLSLSFRMKSIGKRMTKEPDCLLHRLLQLNKNMNLITTTIVTPTTTTPVTTTFTTFKISDNISVSNSNLQQNVPNYQPDSTIITTLKNLMRHLRTEVKQNGTEMNWKIDELQLTSEKGHKLNVFNNGE